MLNPKKYTLNVATRLEELLNSLRLIVDENSDLIEINLDSAALLHIEDKEKGFNFRFKVVDAIPSAGMAVDFQTEMLPASTTQSITPAHQREGAEATLKRFSRWVEFIARYGKVNLNDKKDFTQTYAEEIFADLNIVNESKNHTNPIDSEAQLIFYRRLKEISLTIEQSLEYESSPELKEIVAETNNLAEDLPKLSIYQAGKMWSKICAKIKAYKLSFFEKLYEAGQKEIYKQIFIFGVHGMIQFGHDIFPKLL
jgi:hypothetical protein